ncbi:MAG: LysM peptidoglycan-binding domain-containing protein, partial [Prevotellaceae bacterium]|nr:LysM peptidoglycan-binding domain-containing protein [Prevotellaceae bacterium]
VYLVSGKEIQAYNLQVVENQVLYQEKEGKSGLFGGSKHSPVISLNTDDVFMIKYKDGTKDILTAFAKEEKQNNIVEETNNETAQQAEVEELKVVFHNVKNGETLKIISDRYNLKADDIIKWNDLSSKIKLNTKLKAGTQLMLYVKTVK